MNWFDQKSPRVLCSCNTRFAIWAFAILGLCLMKLRIDRDLPVSLAQQLRGQIEYGIACGELSPASQLPSVRELADELGIATVTVSQVYKELQQVGLLESQPGRGTFVSSNGSLPQDQGRVIELQRSIDRLISRADHLGIGRGELAAMVSARLGKHSSGEPLLITFVGIFAEATKAYVADLRTMLRPGDLIESVLLEQLRDKKLLRSVQRSDLVISIAHRKAQVQEAVGAKVRVVGIQFIPSERTRTLLAELGPRTRLGIISTLPEFLPTMKAGVERFAPHVDAPLAAILEDKDVITQMVSGCEVIVYATGSESVASGMPERLRIFEYRHVPDPRSVERDLLPEIERIREGKLA